MPLTGPSSSVQRLMNLLSSVDVPVGLGGPWRTSACVAKDDVKFEPRLRYVRLSLQFHVAILGYFFCYCETNGQ
jgi:hypothetical protein